MRIPEVKALLERAILDERERCARTVERGGFVVGGAYQTFQEDVLNIVATAIRSQPPPSIRVIRPETAAQNPDLVTPHTIVAGQALIGDEIVDRKRTERMRA